MMQKLSLWTSIFALTSFLSLAGCTASDEEIVAFEEENKQLSQGSGSVRTLAESDRHVCETHNTQLLNAQGQPLHGGYASDVLYTLPSNGFASVSPSSTLNSSAALYAYYVGAHVLRGGWLQDLTRTSLADCPEIFRIRLSGSAPSTGAIRVQSSGSDRGSDVQLRLPSGRTRASIVFELVRE